jgi:phage FluMu gp28-like protein
MPKKVKRSRPRTAGRAAAPAAPEVKPLASDGSNIGNGVSIGYFLPYQVRWLADKSPVKVWEKSRRIGATYVQSYEDVRDCVAGRVPAVWFSSADESAAKEYIGYCERWARMFNIAAVNRGMELLDEQRDIKTFVIEFANGAKIHALSSNPKAFRSKGGKVVLDEFAWHDDPDRMWAAARPCITWGYPLRILSTHNGASSRFYKFVEAARSRKLNWALHTTTIQQAVAEGLVDKILGRDASPQEREDWLREQHDSCVDENTWLQEYCCVAVDEASAFLTYDLIASCTADGILCALEDTGGDLYAGYDVGRIKDLAVLTVIERLGNVRFARMMTVMEKTKFAQQRETLYAVLRHPRLRRACIDDTGIGMQLAEEAQDEFGKYRVEAVTFTGPVKEEMAYQLKNGMDDRLVIVPPGDELREDLHSVRKITTAAGNVRFDVQASAARGHADRFWSLALANHAAHTFGAGGEVKATTRGRRESYRITKGY